MAASPCPAPGGSGRWQPSWVSSGWIKRGQSAMLPELPPPGSCFQFGRDEANRPRLTWRPSYSLRNRLAYYPWGSLLFLMAFFLLTGQIYLLAWEELPGRLQVRGGWANLNLNDVMRFALPTLMALGSACLLLLAIVVLISRVCPRRWPERITFAARALLYEIGAWLREPEREWLAEVLRLWIKQSAAELDGEAACVSGKEAS